MTVQVATDTYPAKITRTASRDPDRRGQALGVCAHRRRFRRRHLELGISENGYVEVRQGLDAGAQVATVGGFILKSELGKGSAEHAH